ncbi:MAG: hypothetical protein AMJ90_03150 [candidate division Zixibacteria bacterium SM23_73_2]|nr:MAG: hypothetical protein AMJ90_03150 [candidate division Zixibacteria bacterium SM23_73_2]
MNKKFTTIFVFLILLTNFTFLSALSDSTPKSADFPKKRVTNSLTRILWLLYFKKIQNKGGERI